MIRDHRSRAALSFAAYLIVGEHLGRRLPALSVTAHGFAARTDGRNGQLRIINDHCPFGDVATDHPVICAVDRGMVKGMLAALVDDHAAASVDVVSESSVARGDPVCSTAV